MGTKTTSTIKVVTENMGMTTTDNTRIDIITISGTILTTTMQRKSHLAMLLETGEVEVVLQLKAGLEEDLKDLEVGMMTVNKMISSREKIVIIFTHY